MRRGEAQTQNGTIYHQPCLLMGFLGHFGPKKFIQAYRGLQGITAHILRFIRVPNDKT